MELRRGFPALQLIGLIFLLLLGCGQPPGEISFEDLCGLAHEQFAAMDEESLGMWIEETFAVTPLIEQKQDALGSFVTYQWNRGETSWVAYLRDGRLRRISVDNVALELTFGQIVDSLGPPETVYGNAIKWISGAVYSVGMRYSALGFSVDHDGTTDPTVMSVTLSESTPVTKVFCYAPGSIGQVLQEAYNVPPELVPTVVESLIPWSGFGMEVPLEDQ